MCNVASIERHHSSRKLAQAGDCVAICIRGKDLKLNGPNAVQRGCVIVAGTLGKAVAQSSSSSSSNKLQKPLMMGGAAHAGTHQFTARIVCIRIKSNPIRLGA